MEHEWTTEESVLLMHLTSRGMSHNVIKDIVEHKTGGKCGISLHNLGEKVQELKEEEREK